MRLFVSLDLPDSLVDAFAAVQKPFADAKGLRLTDPTQAHTTLKFLGDVEEDRLPEIQDAAEDAVDAAAVDPFTVTVGGLGVFPSEEYISVVWVGVREGGEELTRLHEAIEAEMTDLGFDAETHDFTPHFTLARMDDSRGKDLVLERLHESDPTVGTFDAREVRLTASTLTRTGPEYETVGRFAL
jgi:2'-5' RNA ligase